MRKNFMLILMSLICSVAFAQTPVTFSVDKPNNELPSDVTEMYLCLYPTNFGNQSDVEFTGTLSDVTITDSQNDPVGVGTLITKVEKVTDPDTERNSNCVFKLTINNSAVATAIAAVLSNHVDYMVSFAAGSLQTSDGAYNNKKAVAAYVTFWDAVDFTAVPLAEPVKFCGSEVKPIPVEINAEGHHGHNSYNSSISIAEPKVYIEGTSMTGDVVSVEATLAGANGSYTVTPTTVLPQDNGTPYSIRIPAGALKASKSVNVELNIVGAIDALAHVEFSVPTATQALDPRNEFTFAVVATPETVGETIENALVLSPMATVAVYDANGDYVCDGTVTSSYVSEGERTVTVTTSQVLDAPADGSVAAYTIALLPGSVDANLDENATSLEAQVEISRVVWNYEPVNTSVHDAETHVQFTVQAVWNGVPQVITGADALTPAVTLGTSASAAFVEELAEHVYKYDVTFAPISADTELVIAEGEFAVTGDFVTTNAEHAITVTVVPYVWFSTDKTPIERDTEDNVYTFTVKTANEDGTVEYDRVLEYKGQPKYLDDEMTVENPLVNVSNSLALNNGFESVIPEKVETYVDDPTLAKNEIRVTFASGFEGGNYQLNIPVNTIYAEANANDNLNDNGNGKLFVNFVVLNHIDIKLAKTEDNISTSTTETNLVFTGWDVVDDMDATINVNFDGRDLEIDQTGAVVTTEEGRNVVASFDALAEGTYTITVPAGAVTALASSNADLVYTINVEDFAAEDVTINEQTLSFDVPVSDEAVTVLLTAATVNGVAATLSDSEVDGCVTVTIPATLAKGDYEVVIPVGSFKGTYATQYAELTSTVTVIKEFFFKDAANGETTLATEVVADDYDTFHYARTFGQTKLQSLALPFPVRYDDVAADLDLYRIHFFHEVDGDPVLELQPLQPGESTTPNKPYFVQAKATGTVDFTFEDVTMVDPAVGSVSCSTTTDSYTFTTNYEVKDAGFMTGKYVVSDGTICASTGAQRAWRWYMETENHAYVKIAIDGYELDEDGNVTAIKVVDVNNVNLEGDIYNVAGQKISAPRKGINIVNGKKVILK